MALQIEDAFDVLSIKCLDYDFLILMDQSSGHGKRMEGGLNAGEMSVRFGGSEPKMRNMTIHKLGTYPWHLFLQLSQKAEQSVSMLPSPKYHCEVVGEGIEFVWGMLKRKFRSFGLQDKNTKQKFTKCVRAGIKEYIQKKCTS